MDQSDENGPQTQAEGDGRKARKPKRRTGSDDAQTRKASGPAEVSGKPDGDFAAALQMLARLPLTAEERAEAVRRLLATQYGKGV